MPVRVFISYSHKDASFQRKLDVHLAALRREDAVRTFFDGDIHPGASLDASIRRELREAEIFVALASPEYLHSDYCFEKEYQYALRRAARKTMHVVVAVIRPCQWKHTKMGRYKALPEDGQEVTTWGNRDSAFEDIVNGVRRVVKLAEAGQRRRVVPAVKGHKTTKAPTNAAKPARSSKTTTGKKLAGKVAVKGPAAGVRPNGAKIAKNLVRASKPVRRRKSKA